MFLFLIVFFWILLWVPYFLWLPSEEKFWLFRIIILRSNCVLGLNTPHSIPIQQFKNIIKAGADLRYVDIYCDMLLVLSNNKIFVGDAESDKTNCSTRME